MAEVLAVLGGAAAVTQLIHYGIASIGSASALSHNIRHTSDKIDTWVSQSLVMTNILDDIERMVISCTPNIVQLLEQCRKDATRLCSLLKAYQENTPSRKRSRTSEKVFVVMKKEEVERIMSSYRNNFSILASYFTM
jgi:hypothetical protein